MPTVTKTLKDAAYVTVGLGVLGFQQAQVRRRQLQQQVGQQTAATRTQLRQFARELEGRVEPVVGAVGQLTERVPDSAREALTLVGAAAREVPTQVRGLVGRSA